jgi:hypothetical protein
MKMNKVYKNNNKLIKKTNKINKIKMENNNNLKKI